MPRSLNTGHPLFGNLVYLIGVEDDGVTLKDFVTPSRVITPDTTSPNPSSFGTGTYGAHFNTGGTTYTPRGASISPAISAPGGAYSLFIVHNGITRYDADGNSTARESYWIGNSAGMDGREGALMLTARVSSAGECDAIMGAPGGGANFGALGTSTFLTSSARSMCATRDNATTRRLRLYVNGVQEAENTSAGGNGTAAHSLNKIGGGNGSVGSLGANVVWLVGFNKELTSTETSDLHASLGANNAFALFSAGGGSSVGVGLTVPRLLQSRLRRGLVR